VITDSHYGVVRFLEHEALSLGWAASIASQSSKFQPLRRTILRRRADEIIAAFDDWHKDGPPPRGYKKACREKDRAEREYCRIEKQIAGTRATTLAGMLAKIRCAQGYAKSGEIDDIEDGSCAAEMAVSVFRDIQQLVKTA
jgi:beta-phosphoglucomutase-like phosphatase (HAD superfamily)